MKGYKQEEPKEKETPIVEEKNGFHVEPPTYKELEEMLGIYADRNDKLEADNKYLKEELEYTRKRAETFRIIIMNMLSNMGANPKHNHNAISISVA